MTTGRANVLTTLSSRLAIQSVQFVSLIFLSRALPPSAFGVYAIAATVAAFIAILSDLGLGAALIAESDLRDEQIRAAFMINAGMGLTLGALLFALAPLLSRIYQAPALVPLLGMTAATFILSLYTTQTALLERSGRFKLLASVELTTSSISSIAAVASTHMGFGIYSLALAPLLNSTLLSVSLTFFQRLPLRARRGTDAFRSIRRFTAHVTLFNILNFWSRSIDNVLLGLVVSKRELGFYSRAYTIMLLPITQVNVSIIRVLYPRLADHVRTGNIPAAREAWERVSASLLLTLGSLMLIVSALSRPILTFLFGAQWGPAGPILAVLALSAPAQLVANLGTPIFQVFGRTALMLRRGAILALITVVSIAAGLPWGGFGVAVGLCARIYLFLPYIVNPAVALIHQSRARAYRIIIYGLAADGLTGLSSYAVHRALGGGVGSLTVSCASGAIVAFGLGCFVWLRLFGALPFRGSHSHQQLGF